MHVWVAGAQLLYCSSGRGSSKKQDKIIGSHAKEDSGLSGQGVVSILDFLMAGDKYSKKAV